MKLLLQHREEDIKFFSSRKNTLQSVFSDFSKINGKNLKKLANFFKLQCNSLVAICSQT